MSETPFSRDRLLVLLVPLLLCIVAAVQLYLVENHALSRWKGGGFGMFTTVDSPSARFLRIYLISATDEVPVLVPRKLRKQSNKARVLPSMDRLATLVERLHEGTWVPLTMVSASQHYQDLLRAAGDEYLGSADDIQYQSRDSTAYLDFADIKLYRMLDEDEPLSTDKPLNITGVRVEVWNYRFDREELVLRAVKLAEMSSAGNRNGS